MFRVFIAEYDAKGNALRLGEPLAGVKDHERVSVAIDVLATEGDRPSLAMRGVLSAEAGASLAAAIDQMFGLTDLEPFPIAR